MSNARAMSDARIRIGVFPVVLASMVLAAFVSGGCGGGGGGSNDNTSTIVGKVVDTAGNPVAGANIAVDSGATVTQTLSQGGFQVNNLVPGTHLVRAGVAVNGTNYTGSTEVLTVSSTASTSAKIQLSPDSQQATLVGHVYDASSRPIFNARVFLGVTASTANDVASLVTFTDSNGFYKMQNVPANGTSYTLAASVLGYLNVKQTVPNLQNGETRTVSDIFLNGSSGNSAATLTPTNVTAQSLTQPTTVSQAHGVSANAAKSSSSIYEQIRRTLSPAYARLSANRHTAVLTKHLQSSATAHNASNYIIEADVFFDNVNQPSSLVGFNIYSSQGTASLQAYDFLQDPLANIYTDLDSYYTADQQYNFAVNSINTDQQASQISSVASILPLELVTLNQPQPGQSLANQPTFAWNSVNGAQSYAVFVYNQFPTIGINPVFQNTSIAGSATSYMLSPGSLSSGSNYWVVVAASADSGTEISVSQITEFSVP